MSSNSQKRQPTGIAEHLPEGIVLSLIQFRDFNPEKGEVMTSLKMVTVNRSSYAGVTISTGYQLIYIGAHNIFCAILAKPEDIEAQLIQDTLDEVQEDIHSAAIPLGDSDSEDVNA